MRARSEEEGEVEGTPAQRPRLEAEVEEREEVEVTPTQRPRVEDTMLPKVKKQNLLEGTFWSSF